MAGEKNYLQLIRFDKRIKESFAGKYLTNIRLVVLVLIIILVGGITSFISLPKRLNPEVKIPLILVNTNLPGASPSDIESLLTIPLEDELSSLPNVNVINSTSSNSTSTIILEFESAINVDDALNDVQKAVNNVTDLPEDATTPRVQDIDFEDQTVYTFAIKSQKDKVSLMNFSNELKTSLESLSTIEKVETAGLYEKEIRIELKSESIATYGLSIPQISQLIKNSLSSYPAGSVDTASNTFSVTIDPEITDISGLRDMEILINNNSVKLSDIASVYETTNPSQRKSFISESVNPEQVVIFSVFKTSNSDITKAVNDTKKTIESSLKNQEGNYNVIEVVDYAKLINDQFNELSKNFAVTIFLVFIVLLLILGIRQAVLASFTIPLSILVSFLVMRISGISLNFLSLFSLLLALGLLVDNAIVILSAITSYHKSKRFSSEESGLLVYKDFFSPVWATTLTTVWAFLPLLLSTGIIGEFIKTIPIVVSATLIASTLIAFYITIPIMIFVLSPKVPRRVVVLFYVLGAVGFIGLGLTIIPQSIIFAPSIILYILIIALTFKERKKIAKRFNPSNKFKKYFYFLKEGADKGLVDFNYISSRYNRVLSKIVHSSMGRRKTIVAVIIFSIFSYLLLPLGFIKNEFFPASPADELYVTVDFESGTNISVLEKEAVKLSTIIQEHPDIQLVTVQYGGESGGAFSIDGDVTLILKLVPEKKREKNSIEIASELRKAFSTYQKGEFSVIEQSGGPPVGDDIVITLLGTDLEELNKFSSMVADFMENQAGIENVKKSIKPGTGKISFIPNSQKLNEYGVSVDSIGFIIRTYLSGFSPDNLRVNDENIPIQIRIEDENNPEILNNLSISTKNGFVPLIELGKFTLAQNPAQISREDQKRSLTITGSVLSGYNIPEENQKVLDFVKRLNMPEGYTLKTGGVNEENQNSINSILQAMLLSAILILITIVVQLGSFRKAIIVMLVIPLAVSGVFIIFALFGIPLSFPALIGLLALFGIVVNNSIVMIDTINKNLKTGLSFNKSVIDGASSRLEPIFLTSLTTVIGLIPITLSDPLWRGLGGAIISGLIFSGLIMLFFIPVVYHLIYSGEYLHKKSR